MAATTEAWLRGPVEGVPPLLMPAAHALIGAREDLRTAVAGLAPELVWAKPGGVASIGFHLRHIAGSLERLYAYARGLPLDERQRAALRSEAEAGPLQVGAAELLELVDAAVDDALDVLRRTQPEELLTFRPVGRAALPSNTLGLLFHGAEHTQRHTGQVVTTAKLLRAPAPS